MTLFEDFATVAVYLHPSIVKGSCSTGKTHTHDLHSSMLRDKSRGARAGLSDKRKKLGKNIY